MKPFGIVLGGSPPGGGDGGGGACQNQNSCSNPFGYKINEDRVADAIGGAHDATGSDRP